MSLCASILLSCSGCKHAPSTTLKNEPQAIAALTALRKLNTKVYLDDSRAVYDSDVGDTKFAVDEYLNSPDARNNPEFAKALTRTMDLYDQASGLWWAEESVAPRKSMPCYQASISNEDNLCLSNPEEVDALVLDTHGKQMLKKERITFFAARLHLWVLAKKEAQNAEAYVEQK